jgi:hypothetical protein
MRCIFMYSRIHVSSLYVCMGFNCSICMPVCAELAKLYLSMLNIYGLCMYLYVSVKVGSTGGCPANLLTKQTVQDQDPSTSSYLNAYCMHGI